jgi:hypothetical protein
MRLQRIATLTALAAVAALSIAGVPGAGAAPQSCAPGGATILRSSDASRVYSLRAVLYACLGAERVRLGPLTARASGGRVDRYALAGPCVGFDVVQTGVDTTNSTVSLIDLDEGSNPVVTIEAARPLPRPVSFVTVTDLAVSSAGIIAWTARRGSLGLPANYQLFAATAEFENQPAAGPTPFTHIYFGGERSTVLHWRVGLTGAEGSWAL